MVHSPYVRLGQMGVMIHNHEVGSSSLPLATPKNLDANRDFFVSIPGGIEHFMGVVEGGNNIGCASL